MEAAARQALTLHGRLRDRARRAAELAALSAMASRLSAVRDLPALLRDIATQARQLLRTDVSYLALADGDGLRIRYFDGLQGRPAELELSATAGLAGRIAATGRPAWTDDYLGDRSIEHLPQTDSFAVAEGLQSILGVPLASGGTVLGVLFAAERSARPFSHDEVSLLTGLAGHAAAAIENARLFDAQRSAADELRAANDQLRSAAVAVDRAVALHERLLDAAVRGGGPAEVVAALADVLAAPVQLVDNADRTLAGPELVADSPAARFAAGDRRTAVTADGRVLCPVVAAEDYLGCLVVVRAGVLPGAADAPADGAHDPQIRLLERGALAIALSLVQQRAVLEAATRSRGDLLHALVDGGDPEQLERRAAAARLDLRHPVQLAVAASTSGAAGLLPGAADLASRAGGLAVDRAGRTVLLVPAGTDLRPLAAHATVGVSPPVRGAAGLPDAFAAARRCLAAALALGRHGLVVTPDALGVYRFLLAPGGAGEAAQFIARTVGPLLDHDAQRGTDLARTLEAYLDSGRQHSATADRLHVHPNTLYQRLARIAAVLGEDWREPDTALDLHVALRLHRLAAELDVAAPLRRP